MLMEAEMEALSHKVTLTQVKQQHHLDNEAFVSQLRQSHDVKAKIMHEKNVALLRDANKLQCTTLRYATKRT